MKICNWVGNNLQNVNEYAEWSFEMDYIEFIRFYRYISIKIPFIEVRLESEIVCNISYR